ncbi:MAG: helix-turn-helix transcriptional regulator [Burkholderiales bacterium]|nr:MAG: helix-turn-helix transcriptional regulator [Burkholderiales bacterium]
MDAPAGTQIALTKLNPRLGSSWQVPRKRLVDRMHASADAALVVVHGPAGFGKTTAMVQYFGKCRSEGVASGWLTLDRADNDLIRFMRYLAEMLRTIDPVLQSAAEPEEARQGEGLILELVNKLGAFSGRFALFLDDFELIESSIVHGVVQQIVDYLPAHGQLVIGCRTVPDLGVGRLRVRGRLVEIDAAQLRFDASETTSFLRRQDGFSLRDCDILRLQQRTEGWPAALGLVALALRQRPDPQAFVDSFDGSNAAIAEYLMDDVLARQDEAMRGFLLATSVLHALSAPLCDALLKGTGSDVMLARIVRSQLFIVPQDGDGAWYRYHPLFGSFLKSQLNRSQPHAAAGLHLRAANWWLDADQPVHAIEHALLAGDHAFLLDLLRKHAGTLLWRGRAGLLARWYASLPPGLPLHAEPGLMLEFAWALTLTHRYGESLKLLDTVERGLVDTRVLRSFILAMTDQTQQALDMWRSCAFEASAAPPFVHGIFGSSFGYCLVAESRFTEAMEVIEQARQRVQSIGNSFITPMALCLEGAINFAQGRLGDASRCFRAALMDSGPASMPYVGGKAVAAAFLAEALYESGRLDEAQRLLAGYLPLLKDAAAPDQLITSLTVLARIAMAQQRNDDALLLLDEMEMIGHRQDLPRMVASARLERGRIALLNGQLEQAQAHIASGSDERFWRAFDGLVPLANDTESPAIARFRLCIRSGRADVAVTGLRKLLKETESLKRHRRALKLSILLAQALCVSGEKAAGLRRLRDAVQFAAREGFVRSFADEGPDLLRLVAEVQDSPRPPAIAGPAGEAEGLLSGRELQVLRLLAEGHRNREIAQRLFVSETTVKAHLRNINVKLGADNRTHAIALGRQMRLVA